MAYRERDRAFRREVREKHDRPSTAGLREPTISYRQSALVQIRRLNGEFTAPNARNSDKGRGTR